MQLDGWHDEAITRPLSQDERARLQCRAAEARPSPDLAGQGADTFHFSDLAFQNDVILHFQDGIDRIWFAPTAADDLGDFAISGNGSTSVVLKIGGNALALNGTVPITLTADDFLFA